MNVTPCKLILMRFYNVTFGRFVFADKVLRKVLVKVLVKNKDKKDAYNQSSSFFSNDQLKGN